MPLDADQLERLVDEARHPPKRVSTEGQPRIPRQLDSEPGKWRCSKCGSYNSVEDFVRRAARVSSWCRTCEHQRATRYYRSLRGNVSLLLNDAARRSRHKGLGFDLDLDFLLDLILQQHGRCAYSGVQLELLMPTNDWRRSLERLDNKQGYLRHNVALIAHEFNSGERLCQGLAVLGSSKWSKQKVEQLPFQQLRNVDLQELHNDIEIARASSRKKHAKAESVLATEHACLQCVRCGERKAKREFSLCQANGRGFQSYCKQCSKEIRVSWCRTLRGFTLDLISNARKRHQRKKWHGEFELQLVDVLEMLWAQQGRCFYSDVPLQYAQFNVDWRMSLERLDTTQTYTKDNTRLIALEFNTAAQWSREKVQFVWGQLPGDEVSPPTTCVKFDALD
eukprot:Skav234755  [mRNA]  locus=scaffold14:1066839:1068017:- [translate_table: standard]